MRFRKSRAKMLITAVLVLSVGVNITFGSFSSSAVDEHSSKFGLKNLPALSKAYTLTYLKIGDFRYVGTQQVSQQKINDTAVEVQSMMRIQRGNTTFVYPYKYRMQTPRFKAPAPPPFPMSSH